MNTIAAADLAAAKADALARFGRDELLEVTLVAPIDFAVYLAPFDFRSWCALIDAQAREPEVVKRATVMARRVWPSAEACTERFDRRPAAPGKAFALLLKRAGQIPGAPVVELMADVLARAPGDVAPTPENPSPRPVEVIPGLSRAKAAELLAADPEAELWSVVGPGPLSCVMATPDADVYLAAKTADQRARAKGERIVETKLDFVRNAVQWSSRNLDELLGDLPAITADLRAAWDTIGGEGAEASSKSL